MKRAAHITLVDGVETSALDISDRGLAYGDGLFETIRVTQGEAPLLSYHLQRFKEGVLRLRLGSAKELVEQFEKEYKALLKKIQRDARLDDALIKVIVTRGSGGRGYQPGDGLTCKFISQVFTMPTFPQSYYDDGIELKVCQHTLSEQPILAGIKHLNRLDQVMGSLELDGVPEGLMLSRDGYVVEGTKSNVLIFEGERVITPLIDRCGVKGTLRAYILENMHEAGYDISEETISLDRFKQADNIAMINSVFGLWPVNKLGDKAYNVGETCSALRQYLQSNLGYL